MVDFVSGVETFDKVAVEGFDGVREIGNLFYDILSKLELEVAAESVHDVCADDLHEVEDIRLVLLDRIEGSGQDLLHHLRVGRPVDVD